MEIWWISKLDEYKNKFNISDVKVAKRLDISTAMLAHAKAGRRDIPLHGKVRLLNGLGYIVDRELILSIVGDDLRSALVDTNALLDNSGSNAGLDFPP